MQAWRPAHAEEIPPADVDLLGYGGFLAQARADGHEVHPGPCLLAQPAAPMSLATWQGLKAEVLDALERAGKVDGIFLFLHGACGARDVPDCEGDLLEAIREVVGPATPVAVELDLHANLTRRMVELSDLIVGCQEYPHVDFAQRGRHACEMLVRTIRGEIQPFMAVRRLPLCGIYPTTSGPMKDFVQYLRELESEPAILSATVLHGFLGSDNEEMGGAVIVISDGDEQIAETNADMVASRFATAARATRDREMSVDEALDAVENEPKGPIVLADRTDNPGGGAACDSTWLLQAILDRGMTDVAIGGLWDPVAVEIAHIAGEGGVIPLRIGGKIGPLSGNPVDLEVTIVAVRDNVHQAFFGKGAPTLPAGRSALVRAKGVDIVLMSERQQVFDVRLFTDHGVDLAAKKLVVVKSTQHFHESFAPIATRIIYCDPPGTCALDMKLLPYKNIRRPIYPLDPDTPIKPEILK